MREAVRSDGMPYEIYEKNGEPFLQEDFADNAFVYASIQLMDPGERDDGWHTDGGCSLLHAGVTLFGTRTVQVKTHPALPQLMLEQKPGSFYVGNLAALEHNVHHHQVCEHTFDGAAATATYDREGLPSAASDMGDVAEAASAATAQGDSRLQIAVMLRCDVVRD